MNSLWTSACDMLLVAVFSPFFEQRAEEQVRHIEVSLCELAQPGKKNINRCSFHQCF